MENKIKQVKFRLSNITTEQFAIIEDSFVEGGKIEISTKLRFGANDKQKLIGIFTFFTFESDEKPFIIIEASCHFQLIDDAWKEMYNTENNSLTVPKGFLSHLAMLTIGTSRGILHAKTENTCFNKYVLPTINVTELVKEDLVLSFNI